MYTTLAAMMIHMIIGLGQSNSLGSNGTPGYSTIAEFPNDAFMFNGWELAGLANDSNSSKVIDPKWISRLIPLHEGPGFETIGSQTAFTIQDLAKRDGIVYRTVSVQLGVSSTGYAGLKRGTQPYANALTAVQACRELAISLGYAGCQVDAVTVLHGEWDFAHGTTAAQYQADLSQWISDLNNDIPQITGQNTPVTMFTDQMLGWGFYGTTTDPRIHLAQLAAADNQPGQIVMVGPSYQAEYNAMPVAIHFTGAGQRMMGEYFGRAIYYQVVRQACCGWQPLEPSSASMIAPQTVRIAFRVPVAPLVIDPAQVTSPNGAADGFYVTDATGNVPVLRVDVNPDGRSLNLALGRSLAGNARVDYARDASNRVPGPFTGPRGPLRDSESMPSRVTGSPLSNWCVAFSMVIQ